jgi:serine/threonine protein kinase
MSAPTTIEEFVGVMSRSGLVEEAAVRSYVDALRAAGNLPGQPRDLARAMIRDGLLTRFQSQQVLQGKTRGFLIAGKYKLLEHLGQGGMAAVFLCEHTAMRRRVAIKVLPSAKAKDSSYLERFYREARAVAALDHPNIVRAHDIDRDGAMHFLVMEYIDGSSLQEIIKKHGPMEVLRACHYIRQAALGLQHAHDAGIVHRDVKPGNLLVDRTGTVKILDLGLARFFRDDDNLSKRFDELVLGTTDYLAPEQAQDSAVDFRADIYSLGATFYFLLTGRTLFGEGMTVQKLLWQQLRQPTPICSVRPEVPKELADLVEQRMLAKDPEERFQVPADVAAALEPWVQTPILPPPPEEMPQLCRAASRGGPDSAASSTTPGPSTPSGRTSLASPQPRSGPSSTAPTVRSPKLPSSVAGVSPSPKRTGGKSGSKVTEKTLPDSSSLPAEGWRQHRRVIQIAAGALAVAFAGIVLWWALGGSPKNSQTSPTSPAVAALGNPQMPPPSPLTARSEEVPGVVISTVNGSHHVRAAGYEAVVEPDGCLTSLRVAGVEFLRPGLDISRGAYFHLGDTGVPRLPAIEQPAANVLTARCDKASVRYEFGNDAMTWTLTNATDQEIAFYLVFSADLEAGANERGEWARVPARQEWPAVTWFADKARLKIRGGHRVWPWFQNSQVYQVALAPHETRQVVLEPGLATPAEQGKAAAVAGRTRHIRKPGYEAEVDPEGCLTSLRVGGAELLWVGGQTSRGGYFFQDKGLGRLSLPTIEQPSGDIVDARGDLATVRYEFGPETLTCTLNNVSSGVLHYFLVFDTAVQAVTNGKGEWAKTPVAREWPVTAWFAGKSKISISGGTRIWGPWEEGSQVWQAQLAPGEKRQVVLSIVAATRAENNRVTAALGGGSVVEADLNLLAPRDYQVFQRYSRLRGQVLLQGNVRVFCDKVEVRMSGKSLQGQLPDTWRDIPLDAETRAFELTLPAPAGGWYKVEVRALRSGQTIASAAVEHVGVGEVFVGAGQSNETNCAEERLKPQSGMVATFSGTSWRPADDPQPGVHDKTGGGSFWPAFGDALYEKYQVPIGVASTGHSGSSISQWQKGGEYYRWLLTRMTQLGPGGFRAVLWHQGESDVRLAPQEYIKQMTALIEASKKDAAWDFPWLVAQVSYLNPREPSFPALREAQKKLWDTKVALEGPDTDTLTGNNRDDGGKGIHFSGKGQRAHGKLWAEKVGAYLDRVLAEDRK